MRAGRCAGRDAGAVLAFAGWLVVAGALAAGRGEASPDGAGAGPGARAAPGVAPVASRSLVGRRLLDAAGAVHVVGASPGFRGAAFVFLATECPISNECLPGLSALARERAAGGLEVYGVVSDPRLTRARAAEHAKQFALGFPLLFDATGELAHELGPSHTPEAFLLSSEGALVYRGRLDDRWLALGRPNAHPSHHELEDAVSALLDGKAVRVARTEPVGCVFESPDPLEHGAPVTYARDVAPILAASCVDCHHAGTSAPFSLGTYDEAAAHAKTIAIVTASHYMPPWHATEGAGRFHGERRLSAREVQVLAAWAAGGAPPGEAADLPAPRVFSSAWALGEPDMVLSMPHAFEIPATGPDVYRAFVVPAEIPEDRYVVATEFRPGAPRAVHHCLVYLDANHIARALEEDEDAPGYPSFGGPGFPPTGGLGGWAPGAQPSFLPEGMGRLVKKGSDVVLQIHYHPTGKPESDRSQLALYFAKEPVGHEVVSLMTGRFQLDIPAGDAHHVERSSATLPVDTTAIGVWPHMHLIGRSMKLDAHLPSGEVVPLVRVEDWDFRWQEQYAYERPLRLPRGTRLDLEAVYDNSRDNPANPSDPPKRVRFGEQTTDEMFLCFLQVALDRPEDAKTLGRLIFEKRIGR